MIPAKSRTVSPGPRRELSQTKTSRKNKGLSTALWQGLQAASAVQARN